MLPWKIHISNQSTISKQNSILNHLFFIVTNLPCAAVDEYNFAKSKPYSKTCLLLYLCNLCILTSCDFYAFLNVDAVIAALTGVYVHSFGFSKGQENAEPQQVHCGDECKDRRPRSSSFDQIPREIHEQDP